MITEFNKLTNLEAAIRYAKMGFAVFPARPKDKRPLTKNGFKDATKNIAEIKKIWLRYPDANVAIATGLISNLFVLDDDTRKLNLPSPQELLKEPFISTVKVLTGGNGGQYYFRPKKVYQCKVGLLPGIDIRGDGGYVIAPPSVHPSGKRYQFIDDDISDTNICEVPEWLDMLFDELPKGKSKSSVQWTNALHQKIAEGERNGRMTSLCGYLLRKRVDSFLVAALLVALNEMVCSPPLHPKEIIQIVNSLAKRELKRRAK